MQCCEFRFKNIVMATSRLQPIPLRRLLRLAAVLHIIEGGNGKCWAAVQKHWSSTSQLVTFTLSLKISTEKINWKGGDCYMTLAWVLRLDWWWWLFDWVLLFNWWFNSWLLLLLLTLESWLVVVTLWLIDWLMSLLLLVCWLMIWLLTFVVVADLSLDSVLLMSLDDSSWVLILWVSWLVLTGDSGECLLVGHRPL